MDQPDSRKETSPIGFNTPLTRAGGRAGGRRRPPEPGPGKLMIVEPVKLEQFRGREQLGALIRRARRVGIGRDGFGFLISPGGEEVEGDDGQGVLMASVGRGRRGDDGTKRVRSRAGATVPRPY